MKKTLSAVEEKALTRHILEMASVEQELRKLAKPGKELANYLIYAVDALHHQRIEWIIDHFGYPTRAMIGDEALKSFWILVQHIQYDTDLQKRCLKHCKFGPVEEAHLQDRILIQLEQKQMYGTQRRRKADGTFELFPVKDEKGLARRREKMGLEPLK